MYLYQDQRRIGTLDLELQDFLSERVIRREFMKVFSGRELVPILSWGVNLTLGLVDSGPVNVTRIKLRDHSGVISTIELCSSTCRTRTTTPANLFRQSG
jgi:LMBR1 domain-containing protein 1